MKHLFCINPAAGKYDHTLEYETAIRETCGGLDYDVFVSQAPGEIISAVKRAALDGGELRVYACGGDGTLNEVVNGAAGFRNVAVTHWPGGSGNDFVRLFSHPERFQQLDQLLDAQESSFDLIQVGDRWCIGVASIGIDARIGTQIGRYKRWPLVTGPGAYAISTLVNVIQGIHQHYRISLDDQVVDGSETMVCLCNGRWYGSGYNPVPTAMPDDGLMDVLLVRKISRLQVAKIIGQYKIGQYAQLPDIISHYRCRKVTVACDKPNAINIDGELMTDTVVTFQLHDQAVRFFYPRGETYAPQPAQTAVTA